MDGNLTFPAWVRVIKLQACADAQSPDKIRNGRVFFGFAPLVPANGRRFELFTDSSRLRLVLSTSPVRERLNPWIFMTINSFYLIETEDAPVEAAQLVKEDVLAD
ncbi:hypothetical protein [Hymenobacter daeguensis]